MNTDVLSTAGVGMAVLAVAGVITAGCGKPPSAPSPSAPPQPPSASPPPPPFNLDAQSAQQRAAFALFEVAAVHAEATTSAIRWTTTDGGKVFDPCASGSMRASLDGGVPPPKGTFLPTGSHTYEVSFTDCWQGLGDIGLTGVASAAYTVATWSNVTATVSADSVRVRTYDYVGDLEVTMTADGSAVWTSGRSSTWGWTPSTYTPATGSRLVNHSTGNVATFGGGSYSTIGSTQGSASKREWRFEGLNVAINGTEYTLAGSHDQTQQPSGSTAYTGEIRITSHGTLVARIYGDASGARIIEVLGPLVPF